MTERDSRIRKSAVSNPSLNDLFTFMGFLSLKDDWWNIELNLIVRRYAEFTHDNGSESYDFKLDILSNWLAA